MLNWENKVLSLFDSEVKKDIKVNGTTYTLDGKNVYIDFVYNNKIFTLKFIYRYMYISIDDRPKDYVYTAEIFDKNYKHLFTKDVYTYSKINNKDLKHQIKEIENEYI